MTFHGVVPGMHAKPLGQITLSVIFGDEKNFRKESLSFVVVNFKSEYHAMFGWLAYAKFMPQPSYVYLKLKMLGPKGVITISGNLKRAEEIANLNTSMADASVAEVEFVAYKLAVDPSELPMVKKPTPESSFQLAKGTKKIQVHPSDPSKTTEIADDLDPK
jgi:hypothetical protein